MATELYILFEHATGYGLFYVQEVEDIGALLPAVERAITDFSLFASAVKLVAFSPFKSSTNALDNINAVSEGILHDDLKVFLDTNVPKSKSNNVLLGIGDTRVSNTIQESTGIKCTTSEAVAEILRGLRVHFSKMVKGLTAQAEAKAQLGLGHSYCRAKVKFNVHRSDNMIIQSIALLDQLDKDVNTFSMRVKEWYSYHFPELVKLVTDNYMYCKLVKAMGNRKELKPGIEEMLEEITMDSALAKMIVTASKQSMGMDISAIDLIHIQSFCLRVLSLTEYRKSLYDYLQKRMHSIAPNLSTLIGDIVGARLISHAGSLTNLAKYPASTVQILGAEKALFRALKARGNTPKYGLIFHSTYIGRAAPANKGRISRYLANKCSIATRVDCFSEFPNNIFGTALRNQVEERMKFFETGDLPRKNIDVMKEAVEEANAVVAQFQLENKKEKKAKRKSAAVEETPAKKQKSGETEQGVAVGPPTSEKKKKKKKKKAKDDAEVTEELAKAPSSENDQEVIAMEAPVSEKKKKKKKAKDEERPADISGENDQVVLSETPKSKKKKKKKEKHEEEQVVEATPTKKLKFSEESVTEGVETPKTDKKKKKKLAETPSSLMNGAESVKKKKKKKANISVLSESNNNIEI